MTKNIYLDHNANTPVAPSVIDAISSYLRNVVGNASSVHRYGRHAKKYLTKAHDTISEYLEVRPDEIVFTSGGTEGANLVIRGLFGRSNKGHIITSSAEHSSVYETVKLLEEGGVEVTYLNPGLLGSPSLDDVRKALRSDTQLIALMSVNNETGVKTDVSAIAELAESVNVPLFVDAVAHFGREEITIPSGVSAMSFSGQKIHATMGVGFCFIRKKLKLSSHSTGGGHQFGRRAGTENLPGIVGMTEAVRLLKEELPDASQKMKKLRDHFEEELLRQLSNVKINGEGDRVVNTSNLFFEGVDGETFLHKLDLAGIAASHGSACSSGGLEPSRVLIKMGYSSSRVRSSIRFSFSRLTTQEEIDTSVEVIIKIVNELRSL